MLRFHLFIFIEHGIRLAEVDAVGAALFSLDNSGDNLADLAVVFVVYGVPLFFADSLKNDILGIHRGDSAKRLGIDINRNDIARDHMRIRMSRFLYRHLKGRIHDMVFVFHDLFFGGHGILTGLGINPDVYIVVFSEMRFAGCQQRLFYRIKKRSLAYSFFFLKQFDGFFQFRAHIYGFLLYMVTVFIRISFKIKSQPDQRDPAARKHCLFPGLFKADPYVAAVASRQDSPELFSAAAFRHPVCPDLDFSAHGILKITRPLQLSAESGRTDLEYIRLFNKVLSVQKRIDRPADCLAVINTDSAVFVNKDAQKII